MSRVSLLFLAACTGPVDLEQLQDPEACAACHPTHHDEWSGSMHAYAGVDPLFLAMNAKGQEETNGELGDFCVQCHAPLAVRQGLTDDGLNLDQLDPKVLGIPCFYCHSVDGVDGESNNPLTLADDGVMRGGIADPVANRFHASKYSPLLDRNDPLSSTLCGSCHDIVTPGGSHIERTFQEWKQSLFARDDLPDQNLNCSNCHMDGENGPVAESGNKDFPERRRHAHTWPAVDLAITPFPNTDVQRALVQDELDGVLLPRLCVDIDAVNGDATITVDLENIAAGHSFPSGAGADRRVWVEVIASREGAEVFATGVVPEGTAVTALPDPQLWRLGDKHFDAAGEETIDFWEVESFTSDVLPAPTARDLTDPRWIETHRIRSWTVEGVIPDQVTLRVRMRPFGLDIIDDLASEGRVDGALRDRIVTFELGSASLEWLATQDQRCVPQ